MTRHPIPSAALDDRIAIVGTSGSGKTYAAGTVVELLLAKGHRVVILDPTDVWWGLRVAADGKGKGFDLPIFGGSHGDIPLTRSAGGLLGETVVQMRESCIVSLGDLHSRKAECEFALPFLEALYYKSAGAPFHLIIDEADLFAPQKPQKGEERLLGMMENVVRRGRVKGFIPWLITQRPAVLNKNVLSQAVGLIAMMMTSSQDRAAIGAWIEGQADKEEGKAILAALPTLQKGEGYVWLPQHRILDKVSFPAKTTYDSSRAPKRGEKVKAIPVKPLDLGALKQQLAKVEEEAKANDPTRLKGEIARLKADLAKAQKAVAAPTKAVPAKAAAPDPQLVARAEARGFQRGYAEGWKARHEMLIAPFRAIGQALTEASKAFAVELDRQAKAKPDAKAAAAAMPLPVFNAPAPQEIDAAREPMEPRIGGVIATPQQRIIDALAWAKSIGLNALLRPQLAFLADASPKSSSFGNNLGALRSAGMIDYTPAGVVITGAGAANANTPDALPTSRDLQDSIRRKVQPAQWRILEALISAYPGALEKTTLAEAAGASPTSSSFGNNLGFLRSLGLLDYPESGKVQATGILFLEGR